MKNKRVRKSCLFMLMAVSFFSMTACSNDQESSNVSSNSSETSQQVEDSSSNLEINVVSLSLSGEKTTYTVGDVFEKNGLVVNATMSDNSKVDVSANATVETNAPLDSTNAFTTEGSYKVTVKYEGVETIYNITVEKNAVVLKLKTAVLTSTENEGELSIKAAVNGAVGKVYVVLSTEEKEIAAEEIVKGREDSSIVWKGNSGETTEIEEIVTSLEPGKKYYAYFVVSDGENYSQVYARDAVSYKVPLNMGSGTQEDPFIVRTAEDFVHIGTGVYDEYNLEYGKDKCYVLANDIDLSTVCGETLGSFVSINLSSGGIVDGAGYTVKNLYINETAATVSVGLFSKVDSGAVVKNLKIANANITSNGYVEEIKGADKAVLQASSGVYVGILTGDLKGKLDNCHVTNSKVNVNGSRVGGLAGRVYSDIGTEISITDCSVINTQIIGSNRLGGIAGLVDNKDNTEFITPLFKDLYFEGTISGSTYETEIDGTSYKTLGQYVGGIAGYFRSATMDTCVVKADVSGETHCGGIAGFIQKRSASSTVVTSVLNSIFSGTITVKTGSNASPIVGNRSTSYNVTDDTLAVKNCYYLSTTTIKVGDGDAVSANSFTYASTARPGTMVLVDDITAEWYATNLASFDFTNKYKLDAATYLPIFK